MLAVEASVKTAADQVLEAVAAAKWYPRRVVIAAIGDDPLWVAIEARCAKADLDVTRSAISATSRVQRLLDLADSCGPGDLAIVHDDVSAGPTEDICDATRTLCATGVLVMFVEFPTYAAPAADRLRALYLTALSHPVDLLVSEMERVRCSLRLGSAQLQSGDSSLDIHVDAILDDFAVLATGPQILQLPLGEVWLLVSATEGELEVDFGRAGQMCTCVADGILVQDAASLGPVVEIGIGVNPKALVIPTSLCEKSAGRIHVGLGDDELIGGHQARSWHGDLLTVAGARLTWQ